MNLTDALIYLENNSISPADRFQVLTGFNSETNQQNKEQSWLKSLLDAQIFKYLGLIYFTTDLSSLRSFMPLGFANPMEEKIVVFQFDTANKSGPNQIKEQQKFIDLVLELFKNHQSDEKLSAFIFDDPIKLLCHESTKSKTKQSIF